MKTFTFVVYVGISCMLLTCNEAQSEESEPISMDLTAGRTFEEANLAARDTWNEVAFGEALPQEFPIVEISVEEMKSQGADKKPLAIALHTEPAHAVVIQEGTPGDESVIDKNDLPPIDAPAVLFAVGDRGQYFSSSRLIPETARLSYPYSASGKIFFKKGTRHFICSGSVIASRLVVTAGHCVHKGSDGDKGFYSDIIFVPAWHEGKDPFKVWAATWVSTTSTWATGNGVVPNAADFAVFEVADQEINGVVQKLGDVVGTYGYKTSALLKNHVKIIGYPGNFDDGNIMHQVDTGDSAAVANNTVLYGSDMRGGSSGGPWIQDFGEIANGQDPDAYEFNTIVGITSYGFVSTEPKVQGSSILNDAFVTLYDSACARDADNC